MELNNAINIVEKCLNKTTSMNYPNTEEFQSALREVLNAVRVVTNNTPSDVEIAGIIFRHGEDDYGLWEGFHLSKKDEDAIQTILMKYDTEGCSVRGTRKEIAEEMM